jgi:hypothetical protein
MFDETAQQHPEGPPSFEIAQLTGVRGPGEFLASPFDFQLLFGAKAGPAAEQRPACGSSRRDRARRADRRPRWSEPAYTPPRPDFGASLLLLKAPGHSETVRNSTCMSRASAMVEAALRA